MIIDQIGRHEVLSPINHNYNKICDMLGFFKSKQEIPRIFASSERKNHLSGHVMVRILLRTVLLVLKSGQLIANQI